MSQISIVGLGKLGAPMAACFASKGFSVVGVDVSEAVVSALNAGRAPVFEPGLEERVQQGRGNLQAIAEIGPAVSATDVTMIIVPTPSDENGIFSLQYVLEACESVGTALRQKDGYHLVVITSTVMPGATGGPIQQALERASGKRVGVDFGLCYSPEFIALGSVIRDFLNPDFLLIGESDARAGDLLEEIYRRVVDNEPRFARMNFVNAELAKLSVNTYVTTKIAFANMLARICEQVPFADVDIVAGALGFDSRIGPQYLRGAISYGGPCFPRDNIALAAFGRSIGVAARLAEATDAANRDDLHFLEDRVRRLTPEGGTVTVLGLAYKPNTDVVEEAPGLLLVRELALDGYDVVAYDPAALDRARQQLGGSSVRFAGTLEEAIADADVIVVATPWAEFKLLEAGLLHETHRWPIVIDCWRMLDRHRVEEAARYVPLGAGGDPVDEATHAG